MESKYRYSDIPEKKPKLSKERERPTNDTYGKTVIAVGCDCPDGNCGCN